MNEDLEKDLAGCGDLRALVASLRAAPQAQVPSDFTARVLAALHQEGSVPVREGSVPMHGEGSVPARRFRFLPWASAAGLALAVGLATLFSSEGTGPVAPSRGTDPAATSKGTDPSARSEGTDPAARLVARQRADGSFSASSAAPYLQAFAVTELAKEPNKYSKALDSAVNALVRAQSAEGGWANAELTMHNVAALQMASRAGVPNAAQAYKRGLRYLRAHGLNEVSADEFARAARDARAWYAL